MTTDQKLSTLSEVSIKMLVVARVVKDVSTTYKIRSLIAAVTEPQLPTAGTVHASQESAFRFISALPENLCLSLQITFFSTVFFLNLLCTSQPIESLKIHYL